jgi:hypothetical protein
MNKQDLNELTENWQSDTNWLNGKVDEMFKAAQDHAYALGLKRGLMVKELTDEEILTIAEPFGEFQYGDAQGHKRWGFARAILAAAREKQA